MKLLVLDHAFGMVFILNGFSLGGDSKFFMYVRNWSRP
jgi:hypothetical protein